MIKSAHDERYKSLLKHLIAARNAQGLSIRDLAALIDEPNQLVNNVENGVRKLTVHEYVQYCQALKIDPKAGLDILI